MKHKRVLSKNLIKNGVPRHTVFCVMRLNMFKVLFIYLLYTLAEHTKHLIIDGIHLFGNAADAVGAIEYHGDIAARNFFE